MKRRPYNPQFTAPIKSRRDRLDEAVERDNQVAARRTREYEAALARETLSAAEDKIACAVPPAGWHCSRKAGHSGPCAARPAAPEAPASAPAAPHAQAEPVDLIAEQIGAGAAVISDDTFKPVGRNVAIMVADAMRIAAPAVTEAEPASCITEEMVDAAIDAFDNFPCPMNGSAVRGISKNQMRVGLEAAIRIAAPVPQEAEQAFAWAAFADNGNVIIWSRQRSAVEPVAARYGKPVVPVIALRTNKAAQEAEQAAPAAALRKLCDQLDGMTRRLRPTPGTGQNHSYLMHEDVAAYVEEARAALTQPAAPAVTEAEQASVLAARAAALEEAEYELVQDDMVVAGTGGPNAYREILHYAAQYVQDGPVEIIKVVRTKISVPATTKG
jgi:hypothetical protein